MTVFNRLARIFRRTVPALSTPTPTDILVDMLCQRILAEPLTIDAHLVRSYYESHRWRWVEKSIYIDFATESYAKNAPVKCIEKVVHRQEAILLTSRQAQRLIDALMTANEHAARMEAVATTTKNELAAVDAIEGIVL